MQIAAGSGAVTVNVMSPSGEVADGPGGCPVHQVPVTSDREGRPDPVSRSCRRPPEGVALAHRIAQTTASNFGTPAPLCLTPAEAQLLAELVLLPEADQLAAVGPAKPILDAVTRGFTVEIVD